MATTIREVLTAAGMKLTLYVGGMSYVGIRLANTWVGTVNFYGSTDGINFSPISVTPFASGTDVQSATGNGNWFFSVANYVAVRVEFNARTSGSVTVVMATSQDSSWQDAFLLPTAIYVNSAATNALNSLVKAAQTNRAWTLKGLSISVNGQPAWLTSPNVRILDGTDVLWQGDLPLSGSAGVIYSDGSMGLPEGGITGTPGSSMTVELAAAGSGKTTQINAEFSAG